MVEKNKIKILNIKNDMIKINIDKNHRIKLLYLFSNNENLNENLELVEKNIKNIINSNKKFESIKIDSSDFKYLKKFYDFEKKSFDKNFLLKNDLLGGTINHFYLKIRIKI
jgi:hypothetical protein